MSSQDSSESFVSALFDFSFSNFVTTRIIKVLYILGLIGVTIWSLFFLFAGLSQGGAAAIGALLLAVLGFFIGIVYLRVVLEFIAVVFRIAEHTSVIAANATGGLGSSVPPPAGPGMGGGPAAPPPPPEAPPSGPTV